MSVVYAIIHCPTHNAVMLTEEQYRNQLINPDEAWLCIWCNDVCWFDDEDFDNREEERENSKYANQA